MLTIRECQPRRVHLSDVHSHKLPPINAVHVQQGSRGLEVRHQCADARTQLSRRALYQRFFHALHSGCSSHVDTRLQKVKSVLIRAIEMPFLFPKLFSELITALGAVTDLRFFL